MSAANGKKFHFYCTLDKAPQLCNKLNKKRFTKSRLGQIGVTFRTTREPRRELIDLLSDCGKIDAVLDDVSFYFRVKSSQSVTGAQRVSDVMYVGMALATDFLISGV